MLKAFFHRLRSAKKDGKTLLLFALAALMALNTVQLRKISPLMAEAEKQLEGFRAEIQEFGGDINEVRGQLLLPPKDYSSEGGIQPPLEPSEENSEEEGLRLAIYGLLEEEASRKESQAALEESCQAARALRGSEAFTKTLTELTLTASEPAQKEAFCSLALLSQAGEAVFDLDFPKGSIQVGSAVGQQAFDAALKETESAMLAFLKKSLPTLFAFQKSRAESLAALKEWMGSEELMSALDSKKLTLAPETLEGEGDIYQVMNREGQALIRLGLPPDSATIRIGEQPYPTPNEAKAALLKAIAQADGSTQEEREASRMRVRLEALVKEEAFVALAKDLGWTVAKAPRQEGELLLYDLLDAQGTATLSLGIDPESGGLAALRDGQPLDLSPKPEAGDQKKNLILPNEPPDYGDEARALKGQLNVLIAGKHGSLADTLIFANINPARSLITLISIPRDLYVDERKINSYYSPRSMEELKQKVSFVTGYKIDKYILIDMDAFVEIVDLMGGIEVELEKRLIDPTYKTFDNGQWSTLHYPPGKHPLNGRQALRIARSRHSSSDFDRAKRQQLILEALRDKASALGAKDAKLLASLAKAVLRNTQTDLSAREAMAYFFRYKDLALSQGHVLDTGNVLESSSTGELEAAQAGPEACPAKDETKTASLEAGSEKDCSQPKEKGQYLLLPKGGNWNAVRWYVEQILSASK